MHRSLVDDADARRGEVELALAVDPGELGGLAADERNAGVAADLGRALDELGHVLEQQVARRDVVEQDQRVGPAGGDVVDAVRCHVGAAVPQCAAWLRDHRLRPDRVHRRGEQPPAADRMQPGECAEAGRARRLHGGAEAVDDRLGRRERDPGCRIAVFSGSQAGECTARSRRNASTVCGRGFSLAAHAVELRAAPDRADADRRGALRQTVAHAEAARDAGAALPAGLVLDGDRARRARAQLADRRAGRAALLLHPHDPARHHRRPRAALLRRRDDGADPPAGVRAPGLREGARAHASAGRAPGLGGRPLSLAHPVLLRRRAAPQLGARARALPLLHLRLPDVGAGDRDAAGSGMVRHRREGGLHLRRPPDRDRPRQRLHVVDARCSTASTATRRSGGSRRRTTSAWAGW